MGLVLGFLSVSARPRLFCSFLSYTSKPSSIAPPQGWASCCADHACWGSCTICTFAAPLVPDARDAHVHLLRVLRLLPRRLLRPCPSLARGREATQTGKGGVAWGARLSLFRPPPVSVSGVCPSASADPPASALLCWKEGWGGRVGGTERENRG